MSSPQGMVRGGAVYRKTVPKSRLQYGAVPMPDFIEPQLARLVREPPRGPGWVHEIKLDGYRIQARVSKGHVNLWSRNALDYTSRFREIAIALEQYPDCIIDGEVCALDKNDMPSFALLQRALSKGKSAGLVFYAFDLLWLNRDDKRSLDQETRKLLLEQLLKEHGSPYIRYVQHISTSGAAMLKSACALKLEGIVSKNIDRTYKSGRNDSWQKVKCRPGQEAVIGGWEMNGARLARLLLGAYRNGKFTYIGGAGTGFNDVNFPGALRKLRALEIPRMAFEANKPSRARDKHYCRPELVCQVEFETWTESGKLRQASFKGLRTDKSADEVIVEDTDG